MRSDDTLLIDIVEHARVVRDGILGLTRQAFDGNRIVQLGVTHALQVIGEAARVLSEPTRQRFPAIPWKQIVGMRHRLVHEYFRVDVDRVWDSATNDVRDLLAVLEPVVQPLIDARKAAGKGPHQS